MAAVIMAGTMWRSVDGVMIPQQRAETARKNLTNGNFSDLYPRWVGAREVLLHGRDPYSSNVTAEIQKGYYGRTIDRTNPDDPVDEARFAYPLYVIFLLAPTVHMSFESVKALYRFLAVGLSIASVWFWLRSLGHRGSGTRFITAAVLLLGSFPFVQGWYLTQLSLIVAALFAGTMLAVASGALWAAGIMLALTTIKPQLAIPLASWLMLWSVSRWRERKALLLSFTASMAVLLAGAEILLPGWFWKWRGGISAYAQYVPTPPAHLEIFFGKYAGGIIGAALFLGIAVLCWRTRYDSPASDRFRLIAPLILTAGLIVSPIWHQYDLVLVLPAVLLLLQWRDHIARLKPLAGPFVWFSGFILAWHWIGTGVVLLASFVSPVLADRWYWLTLVSMLLAPTLTLASLVLVARERFSAATDKVRVPEGLFGFPQ